LDISSKCWEEGGSEHADDGYDNHELYDSESSSELSDHVDDMNIWEVYILPPPVNTKTMLFKHACTTSIFLVDIALSRYDDSRDCWSFLEGCYPFAVR
jgi:hypothetical protein